MILKIILIILLIGILSFSGWFLYQNWPGEAEQFQVEIPGTESEGVQAGAEIIDYGEIKQFYPNMRFNHNGLSYYIDSLCPEKRVQKMQEAFSILQEKVTLISFFPAKESEADILVGCSEDYIKQEENRFIAGEGGPTEFVNTSLYNVILKGKILLYRESECEAPVVETHEILHVLGFDHSKDPKDIMYNFSSCDQEISNDVINDLILLYGQEPLPDLHISEVNATKRGRYLDFNVGVKNKGMVDINNASLTLISDNEEIGVFYLNEVVFGGGKQLWAQNVKLPSRSTEKVKFVIDKEKRIRELNENNNEIELSVA